MLCTEHCRNNTQKRNNERNRISIPLMNLKSKYSVHDRQLGLFGRKQRLCCIHQFRFCLFRFQRQDLLFLSFFYLTWSRQMQGVRERERESNNNENTKRGLKQQRGRTGPPPGMQEKNANKRASWSGFSMMHYGPSTSFCPRSRRCTSVTFLRCRQYKNN